MADTKTDIKTKVKNHCQLQGITLKELANRMGITDSALNISLKKNNPKYSTLENIATALKITVSELVSDEPKEPAQVQEPTVEYVPVLRCPHCGKEIEFFVKAM